MSDQSSASRPDHVPESPIGQRQHASFIYIVADVFRHLLPLVPLYVLHGTVAGYVLLTAFDLSLGLILIVVTTRDPKDPTAVDPRSRWLIARLISVLLAAIILSTFAAIIAIPIALPAYFFGRAEGIDWSAMLSLPSFRITLACMALLAGFRAEAAFVATTTPGRKGQPTRKAPVLGNLEEDRRVSLAAKAAQTTLIATFALLSYVLIVFGHWALYVLPILYALALVFYDVRPDLAQRIFPALWQQK